MVIDFPLFFCERSACDTNRVDSYLTFYASNRSVDKLIIASPGLSVQISIQPS